MRPSSSAWIEQQMYTRERRGIFRPNEGYDTIAVSKGLDPNFVKKVLHPFCVYDAPAELTASGEKDESLYPESIHLYHTDQGAFILGRSIYQAQDFTGLRSTFFTHHYIIPSERGEEAVTDYRRWLHAAYADHYNVEEGTELPQLRDIPSNDIHKIDPKALLSELKINERIFKQLLFALMNAATGRKKAYVALDVPVQHVSRYASQLLELLFQSLPYAYRRMIGYVTYSKEPESKKGIHMMFVEKGSLRANDRNIEREYTFDLASGRISNVDIELDNQPYLDFAWHHIHEPDTMDVFFRYADQLLIGTELHKQIAILSYHELSIFYQLEQGQQQLYTEHKIPVLRALLGYLGQGEMTATKQRLNTLFLRLLESELDEVKRGILPEPELLDGFKDYLLLGEVSERGKAQLVPLFIHSIHQSLLAKDNARAISYYSIVASQRALSIAFFDTVLSRGLSQQLFEPYVTKQFQDASRAGDVIDLVCEWGSTHTQVLKHASFRGLAQDALLQKLRKEVEPIKIANAILEQLHRLPRTREEDIALADSELMDTLIYAVNCFLLLESDLNKISKSDLLGIAFLQQPKQLREWVRRFDDDVQSKSEKMLALREWFVTPQPEVSIFDRLSDDELAETQQIGRRLLQQELSEAQFARLVLAFYRDAEARQVEYGALLQFLNQYARNKEVIYDFFHWSEQHHDFVRSKKSSPAYAAALLNYFKKYDQEAFKNRAYRKHYFESSAILGSVYDKARMELSSPLMRLLSRNKRALFSIGLVVVLVAGTIFTLQATGIMGGDSGTEAKPADKTTDTTEKVTPDTTTSSTTVTQGLIRTPVDGVEKEVTVLTFSFATKAEADGFTPESVILNPGVAQETISILKREPALDTLNPTETPDTNGEGSEGKKSGTDATDTSGTTGGTGTSNTTGTADSTEATGTTDSTGATDSTDSATSTGSTSTTGESGSTTTGTTGSTSADTKTDNGAGTTNTSGTTDASTGPFIVRLLLSDKTDVKTGTIIQAQDKQYTIS